MKFQFPGVSLCVCILICNFSVSKILLRSYHQMQLRLSSFEIAHSTRQNQGRASKGSLQHQNSDFNCNNGSFVTRDELRFAKLMILLSFTFVICWGSTMVSIEYQVYDENPGFLMNFEGLLGFLTLERNFRKIYQLSNLLVTEVQN